MKIYQFVKKIRFFVTKKSSAFNNENIRNSNWQKFNIHISKLLSFGILNIFIFKWVLFFFTMNFLYSRDIVFTLFKNIGYNICKQMYKHTYLVTLDLEEYPLNLVRLPSLPKHPSPTPHLFARDLSLCFYIWWPLVTFVNLLWSWRPF